MICSPIAKNILIFVILFLCVAAGGASAQTAEQITTVENGTPWVDSGFKAGTPWTTATNYVEIFPATEYQEMYGFGATFYELAWAAISHLDSAGKDSVMRALFDTSGCNLNWGRIPVGCCDYDFDITPYTCDDNAGDTSMSQFSMARDSLRKIPFIKYAQSIRAAEGQPAMRFFASPWSPPAWMKSNNNIGGSTNGTGNFVSSSANCRAYALYLDKWIKGYAAAGINVETITCQNEQDQTSHGYPQCGWTEGQEDSFYSKYLVPRFRADNLSARILLGVYCCADYVQQLLQDTVVKNFTNWSSHSYESTAEGPTYLSYDSQIPFMQTESMWSPSGETWSVGTDLFSNIQAFMAESASVYTVWQCVDNVNGTNGGWPNSLGSMPEMITIDTTKTPSPVVYSPEFYACKHYSHFLQPGAFFVKSTNHGTAPTTSSAFVNPDGSIIYVAEATAATALTIKVGNEMYQVNLAANSYNTIRIASPAVPSVPILASPANGAPNLTTAPVLTWGTVGTAASYEVQVSSSSAFGSTILDQPGLAVISLTAGGLANNTMYYWRANATNANGTGAWSAAWSFTTLAAAAPATPVITAPVNGAVNVPTNTTLSWNTLATASYYLVEVSTDAAYGSFFLQDSSIATGSRAVSGLAGTTQYYWRVRATNAYGSSSWESVYFETAIASPSTPALSTPTTGSINLATSLTLSWTTVPGAVNYLVEVSTGSTFTNNFVQDSSPTSGQRAVTGLAYNTTYYWQVRAGNTGGPSLWTTIWSFSTIPPVPGAPALSLPPNGAANQPIYQTLSWNSGNAASTYSLQVATVSTFGTTVIAQSGLTATALGIGPLGFNAQYFWETNATNITGTGAWSTLWSFTTISGIPTPSSPANGSIGEPTSLQLSWGSITGAGSYGLQVSIASNFSSTIVSSSGLTADTMTISGLAGNTQFYWHLNTANPAGGASAWSGAWSFATVSSPPLLSQPANGATGVSISPTLSWNTAGTVSTFRLQVATDSLFSSIVKDSTFAAGSCVVNSLGNISTYYWHVLATGIGGTSPWSSTWNFTTIYYPPPLPTLALPGTGSTNQPTALTLSWNSGGNASIWSVQVSTSSSFASLSIQDSLITATLQPVSGLANYTTYFWRIDAGNSLGGRSSWTGAWSFVTTPATPVLAQPTNGLFGQPTTLTLAWGSIAGAASYSLDVSTDITFSSGVTNIAGITASAASVGGLANSTSYYWQVNTVRARRDKRMVGCLELLDHLCAADSGTAVKRGNSAGSSPGAKLGSGTGRYRVFVAGFHQFDLLNNLRKPVGVDIHRHRCRRAFLVYHVLLACQCLQYKRHEPLVGHLELYHCRTPRCSHIQRLVHVLAQHPACRFIDQWGVRQAQRIYSCPGRERQSLLAGRLARRNRYHSHGSRVLGARYPRERHAQPDRRRCQRSLHAGIAPGVGLEPRFLPAAGEYACYDGACSDQYPARACHGWIE